MNYQTETVSDVITKAGPPVAVSGLTLFGFTLPDLVQIATGIYVTLMALDKMYIMFLRYREERNKTLHAIKDQKDGN
jgi:hypothetical protein